MRNVQPKAVLRVALWWNQTSLTCTKLFMSRLADRQGLHIKPFSGSTCEPEALQSRRDSPCVCSRQCSSRICRSRWLMHLQESHTRWSLRMTEPVVQCVRLDTGPNKGIGIIALIPPYALCNTQTAVTAFNLCESFVPSWAVKCEPGTVNILWWALAIDFSSLLWYKHQCDAPSLPYCWDHPWIPTWTLKVTHETLSFSMYCGLSTHFLFSFQ